MAPSFRSHARTRGALTQAGDALTPRALFWRPVDPPPCQNDDASIGIANFGFVFLCLNILVFAYLMELGQFAVESSELPPRNRVARVFVFALHREDGWIENLTAIYYLLAGALLIAAGWMEPSRARCFLLYLGGAAMLFVAGEEISWGQRVANFATPEFMAHLNRANQFNLHNISGHGLTHVRGIATTLFAVAAATAFFAGRTSIFGVRLPTPFLSLSFVVLSSHSTWSRYQLLSDVDVLLIVFAIFAWMTKDRTLFIASAVAMVVPLARAEETTFVSSEQEEYLLGLVCLFYAVELFRAHGLSAIGVKVRGVQAESSNTLRSNRRGAKTRFLMWAVARSCWVVADWHFGKSSGN